MSVFAARARQLQDRLLSLTLPVRQIHALSLVDRDGLTLVSTLRSQALDEELSAFAAAMADYLTRASGDFEMGAISHLHLAGRKRQVFLVPVGSNVTLVAMVDPVTNPLVVVTHLLALAREILELLLEPNQPSHEVVGSESDSSP